MLQRSLALLALCCASLGMITGAYAAQQPVKDGQHVLLPPKLDYSKICKEHDYLLDSEIRSLIPRRNASGLSAKELFKLGLIYEEGLGSAFVDHPTAMQFFEKAVRIPSKYQASAQTHLARLLIRGRGVTRDTQRALELLKEAAVNEAYTGGLVLGQYMEEEGSYAEAEGYYRQAAAAGNANAVLHLVYMYKKGFVTPPDDQAIDNLFSYAQNIMLERVNSGDCSALYRFGKLYILERVVDRSEEVAAAWLKAAADSGHIKAMLDLATLYRKGIGVEYSQEKAHALWKKAAEGGSKDAMYELGFAYTLGDGVPKDIKQGISWLEQAALRRDLKATIMLADVYDGKYGAEYANKKKALEALLQATKDPLAKSDVAFRVGLAYKYGQGTPRDLDKSLKYFEQSAKAGSKKAAQELADAYRFGWGVPQQLIKSLRFTRLASTWGRDKSSYAMAEHYRCGIGTRTDNDRALLWIGRAISQGNMEAMLSYSEFMDVSVSQKEREEAQRNYLEKAANNEKSKALAIRSLQERAAGNDDQADALLKKAEDIGNDPAEGYLVLGRAYIKGDGAPKNQALGEEWLKKAVDGGSQSAAYELAKYRFSKQRLNEEDLKALERGSDEYHVDSLLLLGEIYNSPEYYDPARSLSYFERAALSGSVDAMLRLAMLQAPTIGSLSWIDRATGAKLCDDSVRMLAAEYYLYTGEPELAREYLTVSADAGNTKAMRYLAETYLRTPPEVEQREEAQLLLERAVSLGDSEAKKMRRALAQSIQ